MSAKPLVEFKGASVGYAGRTVLTGVDLEVRAGDFFGILGPNGSGKSTLLKTVLGLLRPLGGSAAVRGARGRPRFGYVPQKEKLDPIYPLSAFEVAAMGTYRRFERPRWLGGRDRAGLVLGCLDECGVLGLADERYADLSGGQRQRVLIARALAAEPELMVLDEPLAGVDITTQDALLELFAGLRKKRKLTVLMVSHRVSRERALFTHVAWVHDGKVEAGPAEALLSGPNLQKIFEAEL